MALFLANVTRRPVLLPATIATLLVPVGITWAGAAVLTAMETHRAEQIRERSAGRLAAIAQARSAHLARNRIAPLLARPTIGATTARIADILPDDADLTALGIDAGGAMTVIIAAPDPDRLREALWGDAMLAALREIGQSGASDGRMRITLRGPAR